MKKILFAAVALVAMASCATEDVVSLPDNNVAVEFDTFVENSTRANDITASNLADFGVYGSVVNSQGQQGMIFDNQKVAGASGAYSYSPAQYWIAGATYDFVAIAPSTNACWTYAPTTEVAAESGVISFDNAAAAANQDLLFAATTKTTADKLTEDPGKVGFTFNHMLSRVKFTFMNGFQSNGNIKLAISDVHITNAAANGTLAVTERVAADEWTAENFNLDVDFDNVAEDTNGNATQLAENGSGSTEHFYLIPAEATYNVTFNVDLYQAGVLVDTYQRFATIKLDLNRGMSYDLKATLNHTNTSDEGEIYPIEFDVTEVKDWANYTDEEATILEPVYVKDATELATAVAKGGLVKLTQDIDLDATRAAYAGLTISKNTILDGNGFKVSSTADRAINVAGDANLDVTIKNLVVVAKGQRAINVELCNNVILDNVTASATHYALNLVGAADNVNVVANNCNFNGLSVVNVWGENAKVTLNDSVLNLVDDEASEGYAAIQINEGADNSVVTVNGGKINITGSANDSFGGVVIASGASIIFNGTEGTTTIEGQPFVINYNDGYTYSFSTLAEAVETAKDGDTIVMTQNAIITSPVSIYNNITLDLNGMTLTAAAEGKDVDAIWVRNTAQVVITGNGTIDATYDALFATGTSKLTIENGTFIGAAEAVYAQANATVEILGGSFKSTEYPQFTLNLKDGSNASIVVKGGKYFQFNPANNAAEGEGTSFVAAGYTVEQEGDWYIVK
jgi:hypothetical protein